MLPLGGPGRRPWGVPMSTRGRIGIRLRIDPASLIGELAFIESRMTVGVDRVWQLARSEPLADGRADDAAVGEVSFGWGGPNALDILPAERSRIEDRLRQVVADATRAATAATIAAAAAADAEADAPPQPAPPQSWTVRDVEFRAPLRRLIVAITGSRTDAASRAQLEYLKQRYADLLDQPVAAVASVIDVLQPVSWASVVNEMKRRAVDRFGSLVPYFYIWDAERRNWLLDLDDKHLSGTIPPLNAPLLQPPEGVDFKLEPGTRIVFVAFGIPELTIEDVVFVGEEMQVQVPLSSLLVSEFFSVDLLTSSFHVTEPQLLQLLQEWSDYGIAMRVVPLTPRRNVTVASLLILMQEQARTIDRRANTFGSLRLLTRKLLSEVPLELNDALHSLADDQTIGSQQETIGQTQWRTNARGVYIYPLLDKLIPALIARSEAKVAIRETIAPALLLILATSDDNGRSEQLGKLIDKLDRADWLLFELLLDELARAHALSLFFDVVAAAKGWYFENLQRRNKVAGLAVQTKYANEPALLRLIEAARFHGFGDSILIGPTPHFDVPTQSILLPGKSDQRVYARRSGTGDKQGVISEASEGFYSETAKVYQPNPELMKRLAEPAKKKVGEIVRRMACSSSETMTEKELIGEAMRLALKEANPPPEKADFVAVAMRSSLRVLSLEEPVIDGVPQLRIRVEAVAKIGAGPWEATGRPELITPGDFYARLTSYNVQHMVNALTVLLMAEMAVGGAIFIVAAGIASLAELVLMLVISEVIWFWTTPAEERTLEGFLEAALFAELQLVGFKFLSGMTAWAGAPVKLLAGRISGRYLGSVATKWIALALRSGVTAAEVGAVGVIDLFATDLFHMTRCRGLSSPTEYWDRFKSGFKLGLIFEFAVIPGVGLIGRIPAVKSGLSKASTYLDAALVLRDSGLSYRQIAGDLLAGQQKFEEVLLAKLENAGVTQPLVNGARRSVSDFLGVLWKEVQGVYEQQAYRALFELMNTPLDAVASKGLSRLIASRGEREIDSALQLLKREKLSSADFLRVIGRVDERAAAELMKPANLMQLARSPRTLAVLLQNPADAFLILSRSFRNSIDQFENYLGAIEKLPPDIRNSLLRALLENDPLPADLLHRAAQALGVLDAPTLGWMRRLNARRIRIDPLLKDGGKAFVDFVDAFSKFTAGDQALALERAQGTVPGNVLRLARENKEALAAAARELEPTQADLLDQIGSGARRRVREQVRKRFVEGPYQTAVLESVLLENKKAFAALRRGLRALNPEAVIGVERGGPFIADAAASGEAQFGEIVRIPKADMSTAMANMRNRVEQMIKAGKTRFAFTDVYFSGSAYNLVQKEVMRPLAEAHPNCKFGGFWMRSQVGFEIGGFEVGSGVGPVLELPAGETKVVSNLSNEFYEVPYVLGEDVGRIRDATVAEPVYVFDSTGSVARVVEPVAQDKTTRDLIIRLLSEP